MAAAGVVIKTMNKPGKVAAIVAIRRARNPIGAVIEGGQGLNRQWRGRFRALPPQPALALRWLAGETNRKTVWFGTGILARLAFRAGMAHRR
jgi:hypothetical protein